MKINELSHEYLMPGGNISGTREIKKKSNQNQLTQECKNRPETNYIYIVSPYNSRDAASYVTGFVMVLVSDSEYYSRGGFFANRYIYIFV